MWGFVPTVWVLWFYHKPLLHTAWSWSPRGDHIMSTGSPAFVLDRQWLSLRSATEGELQSSFRRVWDHESESKKSFNFKKTELLGTLRLTDGGWYVNLHCITFQIKSDVFVGRNSWVSKHKSATIWVEGSRRIYTNSSLNHDVSCRAYKPYT